MDALNLFDLEIPSSTADRPAGFERSELQLGPLLRASRLGATIYDLPPGEQVSPYHYEHNNEEWLIVLAGQPSLRRPSGDEQLRPGDVVAFPEGREGAHAVENRSPEPARVLMLSTKRKPAVAIYPDSDKLAIWRLGNDSIIVKRSDATDYWEGEAP